MKWINLAIGEADILKEALNQTVDLKHLDINDIDLCYPNPGGFEPLVNSLEQLHQAPVIITNGAKQALGAVFYSLRQKGKSKLGMRTPYWSLIPPLAKLHGLDCSDRYDSYLFVMPNNPCGYTVKPDYAKYLYEYHKDLNIPFIHDAVYYNKICIPYEYEFKKIGDVSIYSFSKLFGISGIRLGYIVCNDTSYYNLIKEYIDTTTTGVSILSQRYVYDILQNLNTKKFITLARKKLLASKELAKKLSGVMEINNSNGMFLWGKAKNIEVFHKNKIAVGYGKDFGMDGYVRVNLGAKRKDLLEMIERINGK